MSGKKEIIIVGAGIIGVSTAYYISKYKGYNITLIEKHSIACHASGKAGGFLAKNWLEDELGILGELGYELHAQFGREFGDEILYRTLDSYELKISNKNCKRNKAPFRWITKEIKESTKLGNKQTTAQVIIIVY